METFKFMIFVLCHWLRQSKLGKGASRTNCDPAPLQLVSIHPAIAVLLTDSTNV